MTNKKNKLLYVLSQDQPSLQLLTAPLGCQWTGNSASKNIRECYIKQLLFYIFTCIQMHIIQIKMLYIIHVLNSGGYFNLSTQTCYPDLEVLVTVVHNHM